MRWFRKLLGLHVHEWKIAEIKRFTTPHYARWRYIKACGWAKCECGKSAVFLADDYGVQFVEVPEKIS